jgi:hypothetical protein
MAIRIVWGKRNCSTMVAIVSDQISGSDENDSASRIKRATEAGGIYTAPIATLRIRAADKNKAFNK